MRAEGGGGALALTLVRAVGWLSRGDLLRRPGHAGPPLETPGAQVPGPHVAELAIFVHAPGHPQRAADACRFAEPPLLFPGGGGVQAPIRDGARLLEIDDPEVLVSGLEPRPGGGTWLRLVNLSPEARRVRMVWRGGGPGLARVDLRGRRLGDAGVARVERVESLRGFELAAFACDPPGPRSGVDGT